MDGGRRMVRRPALPLVNASCFFIQEPPSEADHRRREPLCAFLNKPVPEKSFPSGNAPPAFAKRIAEKRKPQYRQAGVNVAKTLGVVVAAVIAVWMAYVRF